MPYKRRKKAEKISEVCFRTLSGSPSNLVHSSCLSSPSLKFVIHQKQFKNIQEGWCFHLCIKHHQTKLVVPSVLGPSPLSFCASTEAPDFSSSSTTSMWPFPAARRSEVLPRTQGDALEIKKEAAVPLKSAVSTVTTQNVGRQGVV